MRKRLIFWLPALAVTSLLGACGSDGVGGSTATVQERIDRCHDDFASCDGPSDDCEASAMGCMNGVRGNGVAEDDIAGECDALYDLCSTKTEDSAFCEELRQACFDCVHRYDDDEDSDSDTDDEDTDYDDADTDYDDDEDTDSGDDRCDRDRDDRDDDEDTDSDDDDDGCDDGGTGGTPGSGGTGGTGGMAGSGGTAGTGGTGGLAGSGGTAGTGGTGGSAGTTVSFASDIQPYFESGQANCVDCHRGGGPAGVDLDSYASILAGGDGFPLVVPFDSSDPSAALIPQLNRNHHNGPDDAGFVVTLAQWIDEGALDN